MRYATLCSGGKDSVLAHHVAHMWGWEPVGLVLVRPSDHESPLFHVPNLDIVRLQAEALGLPLHEAVARSGEDAEWEVLVDAFAHARQAWGADTIVTGAVASEYQRVRVERAGHRAGTMTHHPVWHKAAQDILDAVVAGGYDVRVCAAAADGMGRSWLGRRLDEAGVRELEALAIDRRLHAAGEGGEYETMVLDAPLFRQRIVVARADTDWHRDAGRYVVNEARLEGKAPDVTSP